jgi:phosphohistidine phosphatase
VKTLYLLRHAKSDWGDQGLDDHERPLAPRGIRACGALGPHLSTLTPPEIAWCSSATRTQETFALTREHWQTEPSLEVTPELYLAGPSEILRVLRKTPAAIERALVIGHLPGLALLALDLTREDGSDARERAQRKFPTGALATIEIPMKSWNLAWGCARLTQFVTPRELD